MKEKAQVTQGTEQRTEPALAGLTPPRGPLHPGEA